MGILCRLLPLRAALLALCLAAPAAAWADNGTVQLSHTYVLGDNDTRSEARRLCLLEARRRVLERAGSYLEVASASQDFALAADEVRTFSAALLRVETVNETLSVQGGTFALTCTVRAEVDPERMRVRLERLAADQGARDRLLNLHRGEQALTGRLLDQDGPHRVGADAWARGVELHAERAGALQDLETLQREKQALLAALEQQTRSAREVLRKGLTLSEVESLLGPPRLHKDGPAGYRCLLYGDVWAVFRENQLACGRTRLEWDNDLQDDCHCRGMGFTFLFR